MKLTPASNAASTICCDVAASVRSPNIIVPRQMGETSNPLLPNRLYSIITSCHDEAAD
jgi:hypothetical protein